MVRIVAAFICFVQTRRSSARLQTAYMTRQAVVDSRIMNVKMLASDFWKFIRYSVVTSALPNTSPNPGVCREDWRAKMAGNTPVLAMAAGNSPCSKIHPLRQPNALIVTNSANNLPAALPHSWRARSTKGASECASSCAGISNNTVLQAMMQMHAVRMPPISVARGMVRAGSRTLSAGMVADSMPSSAQRLSVIVAVVPERLTGRWMTGHWLILPTYMKPTSAMANSGSSFSTVVTDWTQPEALMPYQFTNVRPHRVTIVIAVDSSGEVPTCGK